MAMNRSLFVGRLAGFILLVAAVSAEAQDVRQVQAEGVAALAKAD